MATKTRKAAKKAAAKTPSAAPQTRAKKRKSLTAGMKLVSPQHPVPYAPQLRKV